MQFQNQKLNLYQKLIEDYPNLFSECKYIECDDGWYKLLNVTSLTLENYIKSLPEKERTEIFATQVKQKFGGLRFYMSCHDPYIQGIIDVAEALSYNICEVCGDFGVTGRTGKSYWISTLCDKCRNCDVEKLEDLLDDDLPNDFEYSEDAKFMQDVADEADQRLNKIAESKPRLKIKLSKLIEIAKRIKR